LTGRDNVWKHGTRNWPCAISWFAGGLYPGSYRSVRRRFHDCARPTAIGPKAASCDALAAAPWQRRKSCLRLRQRPARQPEAADPDIPPTMVGLPDPDVPAGVVSWVRNRHAAGATLVLLCSGGFTLAATGLVDGKSVATHQICAEALAKRFPQIVVDVNRRTIDHGDIVTAGGFLA
jgi:transcriptional regulator GlxA family with amidase domain